MSNSGEKDSVFIRVIKYLIPWEGDRPGEIARKIVFISAAAVLVISLTILGVTAKNDVADKEQNSEIADIFHNVNTSGSDNLSIDTSRREELEKVYPEVQERFLPLLEINKDIIGWITIDSKDSSYPWIDYPIMQCNDNSYYLTHDFKGQESRSGALFVDYHEKITAQSQPANIIVYGHNMSSGEYFGRLPYYFNYAHSNGDPNDISFYKNHPTITVSTLYKTSTYKIFGGILTNVKEQDGEVFPYHTVRSFANKSEFDNYCANILDRSNFINPDVNLKYGDNLITLSTCMFNYGTGNSGEARLRWVVFARETREGESEDVDVEKAYANPTPLFYDTYYKTYGGKWEGRGWPLDLIQGFKG